MLCLNTGGCGLRKCRGGRGGGGTGFVKITDDVGISQCCVLRMAE